MITNETNNKCKQKSHKVAPMAQKMEKPWGLTGHPWLTVPLSGWPLRVILIKIKIAKIIDVCHGPSFSMRFKTYTVELSREILESSEKILFAP
jgi:hypothetical protein